MNPQTKKMIIEALIQVVESAPTKQGAFNNREITKEIFEIWMDYVNSVFRIISQYISNDSFFTAYNGIQNIVMRHDVNYTTKTYMICQNVLDFARIIINQ